VIPDDDARDLIAEAEAEIWLYTVKEFAALRRVHVQTIYTAIRQGRFKYEIERSTGASIRIKVPKRAA
jgi:hypothetical protein